MAVSTGAIFRIASRETISPFARVSAGILFTNQSSVLTEGEDAQKVLLIVYDDEKRTRIRPAFAFGVGTTFAINRGYYLRWEVRDNYLGLVEGHRSNDGSKPDPSARDGLQAPPQRSDRTRRHPRARSGAQILIRGAILAGGGALRFEGRPKGLEEVGGERILDRVVRTMTAALGAPPLLVANSPDAPSWRPDLRTRQRPEARHGLARRHLCRGREAPAPVVCVAWDMPFVLSGLDRRAGGKARGLRRDLPESGGAAGVEPLCAGYGPGCRSAISTSLDQGDLRAVGFHQRITIGILPLADVRRFGDPELLFFNVNTADDLARAEDLWRRLGSSP